MRSAERPMMRRAPAAGLALATLATLAGCGSIGMRLRDALPGPAASAPAAAASTPNVAAAIPAASAPVAKPARAVSTAPIAPATQRAYDDALAALRANRTADAERGFRALAQSDPDLAGPHANLGLIARQAGRLPEALAELELATELDARQPVMWNQLGITYRQHGDFAKARGAYDSALALDPNYASAVLNLGVLNDLYLGDAARALDLYTRYLALTPTGDATVTKWVADLKNRARSATPAASTPASATVSAPSPASAPAAAKKEKS